MPFYKKLSVPESRSPTCAGESEYSFQIRWVLGVSGSSEGSPLGDFPSFILKKKPGLSRLYFFN
jgi:hypothetical protein